MRVVGPYLVTYCFLMKNQVWLKDDSGLGVEAHAGDPSAWRGRQSERPDWAIERNPHHWTIETVWGALHMRALPTVRGT